MPKGHRVSGGHLTGYHQKHELLPLAFPDDSWGNTNRDSRDGHVVTVNCSSKDNNSCEDSQIENKYERHTAVVKAMGNDIGQRSAALLTPAVLFIGQELEEFMRLPALNLRDGVASGIPQKKLPELRKAQGGTEFKPCCL